MQAWPGAASPSRLREPPGWLVLGSILLAAFALTLAALAWVDRPRGADLSDLIAALPHPRPFVARLSGGFPYAPCERAAAGEDEVPKLVCVTPPRSREAQARLTALRDDFSRYTRRQPEPRQRHLAALWTLAVEGDRGDLDAAIGNLEAASRVEPENGAILSDLAAAFTARAAKTDDARDLVRALDAAERAALASPDLPEVLGNRTAVREVFVQPRAGGPRSEPTRARLRSSISHRNRELARVAIQADPLDAEDDLWGELLTSWSQAALAGDVEGASSSLEAAEWYSDLLSELHGDPFYTEAARALSTSMGRPALPEDRLRLATAYEHLHLGQRLFDENHYALAEAHFARAAAFFGPRPNPLEASARLGMLRCAYRTLRYSEVLRLAVTEGAMARAGRWPVLYGRFALTVASTQHLLGQAPAARATLEGALTALGRGKQPALRAGLRGRLAAVLTDLGEPAAAWRHRLAALRAFRGLETSRDYLPALFEVTHGALGLGAEQAARYFLSETMVRASAVSDPLLMAVALRNQADLLARLDPRAAASALESSRRELQTLRDDRLRELAQRGLDVVEARHIEQSDPSRCAGMLESVTATYRDGPRALLPGVLASRARCLELAGSTGEAEDVLEEALGEAESLAPTVGQGHLRRAFLEAFDPIVDQMVDLKVRAGKYEEGLEYSDRSRSVALVASLGGGRSTAETFASPRRHSAAERPSSPAADLPLSITLVEYRVKAEEVLIWVSRRQQVELVVAPVGRAQIRLASDSLAESGASEETITKALAALHAALIGPIHDRLTGRNPVFLVLDDELQDVPFAALVDPASGRFLAEEHALVVAPSLRALRLASQGAVTRLEGQSSVLALVNPGFDRTAFPGLADLAGTEAEVEEVAALFDGSRVYRGAEASPSTLRRQVARHAVLHVGAHALASPDRFLESTLILAPDTPGRDLGTVSGLDLLDMDLGHLRLAILAACRSAGPASSEGVAGLAWPLLAKGVPQVIATNRSVADDASAGLLRDFYRELKTTGKATEALRGSQLRRLAASQRSARAALEWGSFQLYSTELRIQ